MASALRESEKRIGFLSICFQATPPQIRICPHLQKHFNAECWFYDDMLGDPRRPSWWKTDLVEHCRVLKRVYFRRYCRYYAPGLTDELDALRPDILMLGGFLIPSNYLAYRWARRRRKKVVIFTETFRTATKLRERSVLTRLIDFLYRDADAVFACNPDAAAQMKRVLPRLGGRTYTTQYPFDIDRYFTHPIRQPREGYVYLFANRLTDQYNPLLAIEVFAEIVRKYPASRLKLNPQGELRGECDDLVSAMGLRNSVEFIADIATWDDMGRIYRDSDILLFPAKFSNGNATIIEAMASGLGLILSDRILGESRLIRSGVNGYICRPEKKEFLEAAHQYIDHPGYFATHAAQNRHLVHPLGLEGTADLYASLVLKHVA